MTQTIDFAHAEAPELNRWLAEQPCSECSGKKRIISETLWPDVQSEPVESCTACLDANGEPTGLALLWASKECPPWFNHLGKPASWQEGGSHKGHAKCTGSGRVPKALTTDDLWEHGLDFIERSYSLEQQWAARFGSSWGYGDGDTPLLAAFRAVAGSLQ